MLFRSGITTHFTDSRSAAGGTVTAFSIDYSGEGGIIWDVTDPVNVKNIRYSKEGGKLSYKTHTDTLRTFVAFRPENAGTPFIRSVSIPNQDLHASKPADMIIVTHPLFRKYALKLADIHNTHSGLESLIVTPEEIYNEFSGGITDISAIRNFVKMKYKNQNGTDQSLRYLLLFGDGSYDNKTPAPGNPNYIPTYQSQNSNVLISSYTSDDFYGLLGDDEGEDTGTIDVGIGRLPVSDTTGAGIIVSKIAGYLDPSNTGDWKNVICITADDEDGNTHMNDAEGIASIISDSIPWANVSKIYFDAFKQVTSSNGQFYPDVSKAINNQINSGALIFNYIGHGNELSLGHERVLTSEDINSWKNRSKMPLFITATCEFSRFDDIDFNIITREITNKVSAGEKVLLKKDGGAIAIMSTTRLAYSASNYVLNRNIFNVAFDRNNKEEKPRLGDIIRLAKNSSGSSLNKRNFVLLGDPALELAFPSEGKVVTDSINKVSVNALTDTLKALSIITVAGHIEDLNGNLAEDFNGVVEPLIFGKESQIRTLANDGGTKMDFGSFNEIIFRGKTKASGGKFRFTFIVPRDIDFRYGRGRISYYAYEGTREMNGFYNNIIVGGFNEITVHDTTGPIIKLYLNDTLFRPGGMTDLNPVLLAIIEDKDGINTSGNGIGHDLAGWLDNDRDNAFVLNNHFENDFSSHTRGRVIYNLPSINPGNHKLTMKAWDNFNNSTEESIIFVAVTGGYFILNNILNYPNPFLSDTKITAGHNRPDEELRIIINIYSMNGKLIRSIETRERSSGYRMSPVMWDGKDSGGNRVGKGTFPYKIQISTVSGETAVSTGKMIIL